MNRIEYERIVMVVQRVFDIALEIFKDDPLWQGRTGAYFTLAVGTSAPSFDPALIGTVPPEKRGKYSFNSAEKAMRLFHHPEHLSSWQSRDLTVEPKRWGGAIRIGNRIYSLSGFPELGDEASVCATGAVLESPDTLEVLDMIAEVSQNPYWQPLRHAVVGRITI